MPRATSKTVQSIAPRPATITIPYPDGKTLKEKLTKAQRAVRQEVRRIDREVSPISLSKGGRDNLVTKVYVACSQVWRKRGAHFRNGSMGAFVRAVKELVPRTVRSGSDFSNERDQDRAIENHVRSWIRQCLSARDMPVQLLWKPEGKELIRVDCETVLYLHYLCKILKSGITLDDTDFRLAFDVSLERARKHLKAIPLKALVQGFISARDSDRRYSFLFSWSQTSSR